MFQEDASRNARLAVAEVEHDRASVKTAKAVVEENLQQLLRIERDFREKTEAENARLFLAKQAESEKVLKLENELCEQKNFVLKAEHEIQSLAAVQAARDRLDKIAATTSTDAGNANNYSRSSSPRHKNCSLRKLENELKQAHVILQVERKA